MFPLSNPVLRRFCVMAFLAFNFCIGVAQSALDHYQQGMEAEVEDEYEEAEVHYTKAIAMDPENGSFYLARAYLYLKSRKSQFNALTTDQHAKFTASLSDFDKALELAPQSYEGYLGRAELHYLFMHYALAKADFDLAVKKSYYVEEKVAALSGRGNAKFKIGETDGAIIDYENALKLDPKNTALLNELALIYINEGEPVEALGFLNQVIHIDPMDRIAHANIGFAAIKAGKYEKAIAIYNQVLSDFGPAGIVHSNLGHAYFKNGNQEKAKEHLDKALNLEPHNSFAYKYRAEYFFNIKKMDAGCLDLQSAKSLGYTKMYDRQVLHLIMEHCLTMNLKPSNN